MDYAQAYSDLAKARQQVDDDSLEAKAMDLLKAILDDLRDIRRTVEAMNKMVGLDADGN